MRCGAIYGILDGVHDLSIVIVLSSGREQIDTTGLRSVVQSVLAEAAALQVESLALPLVGAGKANWPPALAAKTQVAAISAMAQEGRCGSLKVSHHATGDRALWGLGCRAAGDRALLGLGFWATCDRALWV